MNAHGLTIDRRTGSLTVPVRAITPEALGPGLELVLLAVKSQDTPAALEVLAPRLAIDGAIVSVQNGLNEELIAAAVGARRTVGCLVNWAADWTGPGRILHGGEGAFVLGELDGRPSDRVQGIAKLLDVVAPTVVSDNVLGYTWAKHVYGALLVATAAVDAHVYEVVERSPDVQTMLVALVAESMAVADAAGIKLEAFDEFDPAAYRAAVRGETAARAHAMEIVAAHYRANTKTKTGIWRDLAVRRRKTEVGALLGATVSKAKGLGVAMPLTERLIAMIEDLETGRRVMSWANIDELVALEQNGRR
jgi:2-dehydropantoate 2-reductase